MREYAENEVDEVYERKDLGQADKGEKWFTFEHSGAWREVQRQFMGAIGSHGEHFESLVSSEKLTEVTRS